MIDYYARVADVMIPHLRGRPTTLKRYPDGVEGFHFFEKRCPKHRPEWVKTATVLADRAGPIDFTLVDNKPTLIWLAQLAALELRPRSPRPPGSRCPPCSRSTWIRARRRPSSSAAASLSASATCSASSA